MSRRHTKSIEEEAWEEFEDYKKRWTPVIIVFCVLFFGFTIYMLTP